MNFADKVVIVTGAGSGIGAAAAEQFAGLSARLALVGRSEEKLRKVAALCARAKGIEPLVVVADVSVDSDAERVVRDTVAHFGRLDVLVNNAGFGAAASIEDGLEPYDRVMATNVRAVYGLIGLATPHLVRTKGNVVNVSSVAGLMVIPRFLPYAISKAALDQLTKCVALELAPRGVRVNSVNPGATRTGFLEAAGSGAAQADELYGQMSAALPLGRVASSGDVADMVVYLASERARSITGALYVVDNGEMLQGGMRFLDNL